MIQKTTRLSEIIKTSSNFQYAINLKYDIESIDKIKSYYATSGSIDVIEDVLLSVHPSSNDRSRILIGPYGKGKSHLVLVIISMLYYNDKNIFNTLLKEIEKYDPKLYDLACSIIESQEKMLPVIISGTSLDIGQSFLFGLKSALQHEGIEDVMPDTYFNSAIEMIKLWEKEYKETYEKFTHSILKKTPKEFIGLLNRYDQETYNQFLEIYPILTSGSKFNPMQGLDVVDVYEDVTNKIVGKGYKGIFVIYDEFSKFLEGSINRNSAMDIKLLQDFAEKCNRSKDNQLHIMLISHKNISNYVDQLPKEKIDAWKAVENRYKTVEINNLDNQIYEIMSHVILKDSDKWDKFKDDNADRFNQLTMKISRSDILNGVDDLENNIVYGIYPLHPITTFILPKISERVAQNERTIFTFLSTNELNTLGYFVEHSNEEFPIMTPNYVYDYFESLFKKENYNSYIFQIWRQTTNAVKKLKEDEYLAEAILKTISLINMVGGIQKLKPTPEIIKQIFSVTIEVGLIEVTIRDLIDRKILYFVKSKETLKLLDATDIDLNSIISDTVEKRSSVFKKKDTLNNLLIDKYVYPNRYNDENEIIRYFEIEFIDFNELNSNVKWDLKIENKSSDGSIYAIMLDSDDEYESAETIIEQINNKRIIFILPNRIYDVESLLRKYDAIEFLIGKNNHEEQDKLLNEELNVYLDDTDKQIQQYIEMFLKPELGLSVYFHKGEIKEINRKALLSRLISDICAGVFSETPIIKNELINNNNPTTTAISNRRKVLDGILNTNILKDLGLTGYGLDVTIMQSTLVATGILIENKNENKTYLCTEGLDDKIQSILDIIKNFILDSTTKGPISFDNLYSKLVKPENKIGLRKGIVPIFIAVVLQKHMRHIVISKNGQEMELRGQLLDDINEKPDEYDIFLEDWNEEKESYIKFFEKTFDVDSRTKEYNTFNYVFKALQRWFMSLPNILRSILKSMRGLAVLKNSIGKLYYLGIVLEV